MVKIDDFYVQKDLLDFHYDCDYSICKGICCSEGCWIGREEKVRIGEKIQEIAQYLRERPELPFWQEGPEQWVFTDPKSEEDQFHTRVLNNRCIFQIPDGRCAIHSYCLEHDIPWEDFKFWICVEFPLSMYLKNGAWHVQIHHEVPEPYWDLCTCIRPAKMSPEYKTNLPHAIKSMRSTIISRIGPQRYQALARWVNGHQSTFNGKIVKV